MTTWRCYECGEREPKHQGDHPGLCCDCFDLSCGMPLEQLNAERKEQGRPPLEKCK